MQRVSFAGFQLAIKEKDVWALLAHYQVHILNLKF